MVEKQASMRACSACSSGRTKKYRPNAPTTITKFVEDVVRDVAAPAEPADDRICAYTVEAENFESIHNHSAYALIERDKEAERRANTQPRVAR